MRQLIEPQMKLGEIAIEDIKFDLRSRDEIPKLLMGLQGIYRNTTVRKKVFAILEEITPENVDSKNGRPGMDLWKIFVLGSLKLCCNWDFDKVTEIANNHYTLRLMLCHPCEDKSLYALQTVRDNVSLFTPEILDRINQVIIEYGHKLVGKKNGEELNGSIDSFVLETDVHYPTDKNLLFDAMRKIIVLIMTLCDQLDLCGWRKGKYNIKKVRGLLLKAQRLKKSTSKNKKKRADREKLIIEAHLAYMEFACSIIERVKDIIDNISCFDILLQFKIDEIRKHIIHAERQIDQIRRRVVEGETIPHNEKVFSIFEEHTEWISKGKAGVPQELGLRVCIVKDQFGFILHHRVMQNETDDKIAVPMVRETKERFPEFNSCSFDKGFHRPSNQQDLKNILDRVVLPRKGRLSKSNREIEESDWFKEERRKHSLVESSIAALENHGLDRCRDHGLHGFKRYVAFAVVARNIQMVGNILQQEERKRQDRFKKKQAKVLLAA